MNNPAHEFAVAIRDFALDEHESSSAIFRGVSFDLSNAKREDLELRLQAISQWQAERNAELWMKLAHLADKFADQAADNAEDGDEWKR